MTQKHTSETHADEGTKTQSGPRLALLVGQSTFAGQLAPLPGVMRDVTALHLQLSNGRAGYELEHVKLSLDATYTELEAQLTQLCKDAEELDASSILLYISTHGFYRDDEYHLCVRDSQVAPSDIAQTLTLSRLREWLAPLATRTQILLLDACRSHEQDELIAKDGLGFSFSLEASLGRAQTPGQETPSSVDALQAIELQAPQREDLHLSGENWAILTSASAGERSWLERSGPTPFQDGPHSLFTRALLEELYTPGTSTLDVVSLHTGLQQRLQQRLSRLRQGVTQTPVLLLQCQETPIVALRAQAHLEGEPFRRLAAFSYDDRHHFFGRDGEITQAVGTPEVPGGWLLGNHRHHILSAPSGAGKTSFLRAGLQPRLESQGQLVFYVDCRTPDALWRELSAYLGSNEAQDLPSILAACRQEQNATGEVILLLDQCESLLLDPRLSTSWERLYHQLALLATQGTSAAYRIVFALREDCVGQWLAPPHFSVPEDTRLDLSDSVLDTRADLSDSVLDTRADLSDSVLDTRAELPDTVQETRLDLSDSVLDTRAEAEIGEPGETRLDLSDSVLDMAPPTLRASIEAPQSVELAPSLIDVLGIDSEQWHTLPFLQIHQAKQAIEEPLRGRGIQFDDDLTFALLQDLYQQSWDRISGRAERLIYPPYLQIACHAMYEEAVRQGWSLVQRHHYEQMGPLSALLGRHLKQTLEDQRGRHRLSAKEQAHAWLLLKGLVSPMGTRQVFSQDKLTQRMHRRGLTTAELQQSLEALSERRLITCVDVAQEPFWTLTHDFLCQLIMQEIERDPEELQLRQAQRRLEMLRDERRQTTQQTLPRLDMGRATPLAAQAEELQLRIREDEMTPDAWEEGEFADVMAFVEESIAEGERAMEKQAQERREREKLLQEREELTSQRVTLVTWGLVLVGILLLGTLFSGSWALQQSKQARQQGLLAKQERNKARVQRRLAQKERKLALQAKAERKAALLHQRREEAKVYESIGLAHSGHFDKYKASARNDRFRKAIRSLRKALQVHQQVGKNKAAMARIRFHMAFAHERINRDRTKHLNMALSLYDDALAYYKPKTHPLQWAKTTHRKGYAHARFLNDRKKHLMRALALYEQAANIYHPKRHALQWASLMNDIGAAWFHLRHYQRSLPKALKAYRRALTVFTKEQTPQRWAATTYNLAAATSYVRKHKTNYLIRAIALYYRVLEVRTYEKTPYPWAKTMVAIANAHLRMVHREPTRFAKARQAYRQALTVFRPQSYPHEWGKAIANLATLYVRAARGKQRNARLDKAIQLYRKRLRMHKDILNPKRIASVYYNIGVAYVMYRKPPNATFPLAIKAYAKALKIYTPKTAPRAWRRALENHTIAWYRLYAVRKGATRERARQRAVKGLELVIEARKKARLPTWPYRLVYAQLKQDPAFLYKEFAAYAKQKKTSNAHRLQLVETALRLRRVQHAMHWWNTLRKVKHPERQLWRLHLRWQIALLSAQKTDAAAWCQRLLNRYQTLQPKRWKLLDHDATLAAVKRKDHQADKIKRSLALFAGPFSCQRARQMATLCQLSSATGHCLK